MPNKLALTQDLTIINLGKIFAQSGYFSDTKDAAQAVVKILAGRELGLPPIASMTGINIIKGKISFSAVTMATVLKRYGGYDYKVKDNSEDAVEIEFFFEIEGIKESIGISRFTLEDAKRAGLLKGDNYKKYPRNMLFARAMSNGIRWYCPDVLGGPAYTPGELETEVAAASQEMVDSEVVEDEINEFAGWLDEETERQKVYNEGKTAIQEIANSFLNGSEKPPMPILAAQILPQVQKEYPNYTQSDVIEMLGD